MALRNSTTLVKTAFFLSIFALLFMILATFTPYWLVNSKLELSVGLFYVCIANRSPPCQSGGSTVKTWQITMAALEVSGLLCSVLCFAFVILYIFVDVTSGKRWVKFTALGLTFVTALSVLVGGVVCAVLKHDFQELKPDFIPILDLGWSFTLAIIGGLLYLVIGILFLLDIIM